MPVLVLFNRPPGSGKESDVCTDYWFESGDEENARIDVLANGFSACLAPRRALITAIRPYPGNMQSIDAEAQCGGLIA